MSLNVKKCQFYRSNIVIITEKCIIVTTRSMRTLCPYVIFFLHYLSDSLIRVRTSTRWRQPNRRNSCSQSSSSSSSDSYPGSGSTSTSCSSLQSACTGKLKQIFDYSIVRLIVFISNVQGLILAPDSGRRFTSLLGNWQRQQLLSLLHGFKRLQV